MLDLLCRVGLLTTLTGVLWGCGSTPLPGGADDGGAPVDARARDAAPVTAPSVDANYAFPCLSLDEREPTHEPSFEAIYADIFCRVGCTDGYCHGVRGGWGGLKMTTIEGAYEALVEQPPGDRVPVDGRATCRENPLLRVEPGAPERSLLYLKVSGEAPCGTAMPPPDSGRRALTPEEQAQVREWIALGAPLHAP